MDYLKATPPDRVKKRILEYAAKSPPRTFNRNQKGPVVGVFNLYAGGDLYRRIMWGYIFGSHSQGELSSKHIRLSRLYGLSKWIGSTKEDGVWVTRPEFPLECLWMLGEALEYYKKNINPDWDEIPEDVLNLLAAGSCYGGVIMRIDDTTDGETPGMSRYPEFDFRNNKIIVTRPKALLEGQGVRMPKKQ